MPGVRSVEAPRPQRPAPQAGTQVGKVGRPYEINGVRYTPRHEPDYDETGLASWYGEAHNGRPTALGERFDMNALSAAHKTLPLPSLVEVTNLDNGTTATLRINDRGPFVEGRIIDLSKAAAEELGMLRAGVAKVRVRYVGPAIMEPMAPPALARAAPRQGASYEVQAGLFSARANAERAAAQIAAAGPAEIRPVESNGATLWRVVVGAIGDADEAAKVRRRVVESGFADARVVGPF
jgi:rare lipoprotein A